MRIGRTRGLVFALALGSGCDVADVPATDELAGIEGCESVLDWPEAASLLEARVIERISEERRTGGRCGDRVYPPQGPIARDPALHCAARLHSLDMLTDNYVGFVAEDELGIADRLGQVGYDYAIWAASVGAGWTVADNAVDAWLLNERQCWKLFAEELEGVGVGVATIPEELVAMDEEGELIPAHTSYWTLVVGVEAD